MSLTPPEEGPEGSKVPNDLDQVEAKRFEMRFRPPGGEFARHLAVTVLISPVNEIKLLNSQSREGHG